MGEGTRVCLTACERSCNRQTDKRRAHFGEVDRDHGESFASREMTKRQVLQRVYQLNNCEVLQRKFKFLKYWFPLKQTVRCFSYSGNLCSSPYHIFKTTPGFRVREWHAETYAFTQNGSAALQFRLQEYESNGTVLIYKALERGGKLRDETFCAVRFI